jgi:tetratricopeptide (TPR) repeat protein
VKIIAYEGRRTPLCLFDRFKADFSAPLESVASYTRRTDSIEAAKEILKQALQRHPDEAMVHFNLGCYASQLGDLTLAKAHLKRAFVIEPKCRVMALDDPDLEFNSVRTESTGTAKKSRKTDTVAAHDVTVYEKR